MFKKLLEKIRKIFKIHSPSKEWTNIRREYLEQDTKCDQCEFISKCDLVGCTHVEYTRIHFIPNINNVCWKENVLEERYKTCDKCIYDGDGDPNIFGSTCYLCKRNPDDHRIDWFEKKGE